MFRLIEQRALLYEEKQSQRLFFKHIPIARKHYNLINYKKFLNRLNRF